MIAPAAFELLVPGGVVILEIGQGQERDVARLTAGAGLDAEVSVKADLGRIPRAVIGRKPLV